MVDAGVDVVRINCSHGTPEEHEAVARAVRDVSDRGPRPLALMLDTRGPEVRLAGPEEPVAVEDGEMVVLGGEAFPLTEPSLVDDVPQGARVLLADGAIELRAEGKKGGGLACRVLRGGSLVRGRKVNVPSVALSLPVIGPEDRASLAMARELEFEYVALSFVRDPEDIRQARSILGSEGAWILAKIELAEAVTRLASLMQEADGAMVARGDLAVELDPYQVPLVQRKVVDLCNTLAKPVVVATQMLESMVTSGVPTRAEVADVATAVWDGADCVMLSAETAVGDHPVASVRAMSEAAKAAESVHEEIRAPGLSKELVGKVPAAMAEAACRVARHIGAAAILCATSSGLTARLVSAYRPPMPIVATSASATVGRRLAGVWGVRPLVVNAVQGTDELLEVSLEASLEAGFLAPGDTAVFTAGVPFLTAGTTNLVRVVQA